MDCTMWFREADRAISSKLEMAKRQKHAIGEIDRCQCDLPTSEFYIFLTRDGRISLAGINNNNVEYIAIYCESNTCCDRWEENYFK